ncbi:uncharacterized protein EHS24_000298 [Apiotrichum porosum]|uniref:Uncharacterized protein n=1 Tax=Apiotrichum porosum TaxID=105984 RepID=A0A427Y9K0_9TREE|nr:uncharacterized protein EHS24_000298 [Apiotrichum porosum]RSH87782.1 hypothetical protein EHS24_000298 [Apiotrichum porosum]
MARPPSRNAMPPATEVSYTAYSPSPSSINAFHQKNDRVNAWTHNVDLAPRRISKSPAGISVGAVSQAWTHVDLPEVAAAARAERMTTPRRRTTPSPIPDRPSQRRSTLTADGPRPPMLPPPSGPLPPQPGLTAPPPPQSFRPVRQPPPNAYLAATPVEPAHLSSEFELPRIEHLSRSASTGANHAPQASAAAHSARAQREAYLNSALDFPLDIISEVDKPAAASGVNRAAPPPRTPSPNRGLVGSFLNRARSNVSLRHGTHGHPGHLPTPEATDVVVEVRKPKPENRARSASLSQHPVNVAPLAPTVLSRSASTVHHRREDNVPTRIVDRVDRQAAVVSPAPPRRSSRAAFTRGPDDATLLVTNEAFRRTNTGQNHGPVHPPTVATDTAFVSGRDREVLGESLTPSDASETGTTLHDPIDGFPFPPHYKQQSPPVVPLEMSRSRVHSPNFDRSPTSPQFDRIETVRGVPMSPPPNGSTPYGFSQSLVDKRGAPLVHLQPASRSPDMLASNGNGVDCTIAQLPQGAKLQVIVNVLPPEQNNADAQPGGAKITELSPGHSVNGSASSLGSLPRTMANVIPHHRSTFSSSVPNDATTSYRSNLLRGEQQQHPEPPRHGKVLSEADHAYDTGADLDSPRLAFPSGVPGQHSWQYHPPPPPPPPPQAQAPAREPSSSTTSEHAANGKWKNKMWPFGHSNNKSTPALASSSAPDNSNHWLHETQSHPMPVTAAAMPPDQHRTMFSFKKPPQPVGYPVVSLGDSSRRAAEKENERMRSHSQLTRHESTPSRTSLVPERSIPADKKRNPSSKTVDAAASRKPALGNASSKSKADNRDSTGGSKSKASATASKSSKDRSSKAKDSKDKQSKSKSSKDKHSSFKAKESSKTLGKSTSKKVSK